MKTYTFGKDFNSKGGALTLNPEEVREEGDSTINKKLTKTHPDGWTITAEVHEDYYEWINEFKAEHQALGKVCGNFEDKVYADSDEAFKDFYNNHTPEDWDYGDI